MTTHSQAEDKFKEASDLLRKMPKTKEREELLIRIIEFCLRLNGYKNGQTINITLM